MPAEEDVHRTARAIAVGVALASGAAACADDDPVDVTITLMTHDSFAISDATLAAFVHGCVVLALFEDCFLTGS